LLYPKGEAVAQIRPFSAVRYSSKLAARLSDLVAPPYDVLDDAKKAALQARHPRNIVTIDLPHMPPKTVGPDAAYETANATLRQWMAEGTLSKDTSPAFYAYAQTYTQGQQTFHRRGFFAQVRLSPFGKGEVFPHEKTYPDAITDRLKLTRATRTQLSPIFGLFSDAPNQVTRRLFQGLQNPDMSATLDEVRNELWVVTDPDTQRTVMDLMASRPIYIADGHHRYTMALQYQKEHPELDGANDALFALVAMQDPGLVILPTHRIIGKLGAFEPAVLRARLGKNAELTELPIKPDGVAQYAQEVLPNRPVNTFGLYDGQSHKLYELKITHPDVLATLEPNQSPAWRKLDVAILQRYLLDEMIAPGREITRSYTADPEEIIALTDGKERQIALLLRPTPLGALEELGRTNEVMPPKSTYFFPKLVTGMVLNPLD
jgi:uncharacterized protein (DUF1015 family)